MVRSRALSKHAHAVLMALAAQPRSWRHGYDLMRETGQHSGTLYPLLIRLSEQGLLEAEWRPAEREGRPPRHAYRITGEGCAVAHAAAAAATKPRRRRAAT